MSTKLAVDKRTALKMFWDAGFNTENRMLEAAKRLEAMTQPTAGYWLADDVSNAVDQGFAMKHAGDLFDALKYGHLAESCKYLKTFGSVTSRADVDDDKGCHTVLTIGYYTRSFVVEMTNGNTLAVSVDGERYTK